MRRVAVAGCGLSKFRRDNDSLYSIASESMQNLFHNISSLSQNDVEAVLVSTCDNAQYTAGILSEMLGIKPKIAYRIENMCNSGGNAIIAAYSYIVSGLCDVAMVVGAEKAESPSARLEWDLTRGTFKHPAHWASMFSKAHMKEYGTTEEQMALVSVKNHKNAVKNPAAYFQKELSLEDVMKSKPVVKPVKLYDCSAPCDGAASLLLASEEKVQRFTDQPVWISGIGQQSLCASFSNVKDLTRMDSTVMASREAYEMANIKPEMINVAEVHDAFTICEILAYEDLGFVDKGKGGSFVESVLDNSNGEVHVNTRGGLIGTGHPIGATGVAQMAEVLMQLQDTAGERQVKNCKNGLVHNLSAAATSSTVITVGV